MRELKWYEVRRLRDIKEEIAGLLEEARGLIRGTSEEDRAKGYWVAAIRTALDNEHDYLGGSMYTMEETINALEGPEGEEPADDGDPHERLAEAKNERDYRE